MICLPVLLFLVVITVAPRLCDLLSDTAPLTSVTNGILSESSRAKKRAFIKALGGFVCAYSSLLGILYARNVAVQQRLLTTSNRFVSVVLSSMRTIFNRCVMSVTTERDSARVKNNLHGREGGSNLYIPTPSDRLQVPKRWPQVSGGISYGF
jgi:hypothetical protein